MIAVLPQSGKARVRVSSRAVAPSPDGYRFPIGGAEEMAGSVGTRLGNWLAARRRYTPGRMNPPCAWCDCTPEYQDTRAVLGRTWADMMARPMDAESQLTSR